MYFFSSAEFVTLCGGKRKKKEKKNFLGNEKNKKKKKRKFLEKEKNDAETEGQVPGELVTRENYQGQKQ